MKYSNDVTAVQLVSLRVLGHDLVGSDIRSSKMPQMNSCHGLSFSSILFLSVQLDTWRLTGSALARVTVVVLLDNICASSGCMSAVAGQEKEESVFRS